MHFKIRDKAPQKVFYSRFKWKLLTTTPMQYCSLSTTISLQCVS